MRWLVDECVDAALVAQLRDAGHDVVYTADVEPSASDVEVITHARAEGRLLLTEDKDFGELVFRQAMEVPGVVLLRIDPQRRGIKWNRLHAAIAKFGENFFGRYTVVDAMRFRSRPLFHRDSK